MNAFTDLGWGERLAIINHFNLSDDSAIDMFGVSRDELETAREMAQAGSISAAASIDVDKYGEELKKLLDSIINEQPTVSEPTDAPVVVQERPITASKPKKKPKKRGRKGTKIVEAFKKLSSTPTPLDVFAQENNVSVAVLRQSRRFDKTGLPGEIRIRKDKETGVLMIWREII